MGQFIYAPWAKGVSNYWGAVLPNRLLRLPQYRQALDDKINELRNFLTPERIKSMVNVYKKTVDPYVAETPDLQHLQGSITSRAQELELLPGDIETNYNIYLESFQRPLPFFLETPKLSNDQLFFRWDEAYDFNGQDVIYHFVLSKDLEFKNIVAESKLTNGIEFQMQTLKPGIYFWRVTAASFPTRAPLETICRNQLVDTKDSSINWSKKNRSIFQSGSLPRCLTSQLPIDGISENLPEIRGGIVAQKVNQGGNRRKRF